MAECKTFKPTVCGGTMIPSTACPSKGTDKLYFGFVPYNQCYEEAIHLPTDVCDGDHGVSEYAETCYSKTCLCITYPCYR